MNEDFINKLKDFLNVNGVDWKSVEHRITKMDNDVDEGLIEFTYNVYIPYIPLVKK